MSAPRHPSSAAAAARPTPVARLLSGLALLAAVAAEAGVVRMEDVLAEHPLAAGSEAGFTEVLRGEETSVNVWQIAGEMPPHLHREHEEVIVVRSGRVRARIGERNVDLGPGDVVSIPKGTVHAAHAVGDEPCAGISVFAPAFDGEDRVPVPVAGPTPVP